jgi:hypothetical protein
MGAMDSRASLPPRGSPSSQPTGDPRSVVDWSTTSISPKTRVALRLKRDTYRVEDGGPSSGASSPSPTTAVKKFHRTHEKRKLRRTAAEEARRRRSTIIASQCRRDAVHPEVQPRQHAAPAPQPGPRRLRGGGGRALDDEVRGA